MSSEESLPSLKDVDAFLMQLGRTIAGRAEAQACNHSANC